MALIVEDGTIKDGAESYVTVAEADAYHVAFGNAAWAAATLGDKEAALRRAAQYIDFHYLNRWKGALVKLDQPRQWPRTWVRLTSENSVYGADPIYIGSNVIPPEVKQAQNEAALRELKASMTPDLDRGGHVASISVAGITQTFSGKASPNTKYQKIDMILTRLLRPGGSVELVRG